MNPCFLPQTMGRGSATLMASDNWQGPRKPPAPLPGCTQVLSLPHFATLSRKNPQERKARFLQKSPPDTKQMNLFSFLPLLRVFGFQSNCGECHRLVFFLSLYLSDISLLFTPRDFFLSFHRVEASGLFFRGVSSQGRPLAQALRNAVPAARGRTHRERSRPGHGVEPRTQKL